MLLFPPIYRKVIFLFSCLILVTAIIWAVSAVVYSRLVPEKLSLLVIAYTLGLRHGLDADHIAAIDNVTRRMVQIPDNLSLAKHHNEIPVTIGLMFSLGHSTMVVVASIVIAVASTHIIEGAGITGIVGTCISATFLILIGLINLASVIAIVLNMRRIAKSSSQGHTTSTTTTTVATETSTVNSELHQQPDLDIPDPHHQRDEPPTATTTDLFNIQGGIVTRLLGNTFFYTINKPWKMYCVGLLFAITLDTATEIALLGIAAVQGSQGVSIWIILCLPLLFTCGMALTDSIDGIAMLGVYSWSMMAPLRKLYFTLIISLVSVLLAFSIAVLEILSLVAPDPGTGGPFWDGVTAATNADNFVIIGGFVVVTFLGSWAIAAGIYSCMTRIRKKSHSLKA